MTVRETAVDSEDSRRLLTDYFAWRAAEFPSSSGSYTVHFPEPAAFDPPRGVFLLALDKRGRVRYEVKHVWLEPQNRGRGLATTLMAELEDRARRFGADLVVLDTHDSLQGAARLYARLGYGRVDAYNDNPNATVWYAKALSPA